MKRVTVTGVHGFVGGLVYKSLISAGYDVIPVVRKKDPSLYNSVVWDITEPYSGEKIHTDYVVHCAGMVDDWVSYDDAYKVNVTGTKHILAAFSDIEKFIYVSSASVYNPHNESYILTENSKAGTNLLNGYSNSKYEAEQCIFNHESTSQKIVLRPHIIYGDNDKKIIPRLIKAKRFNRFIVLGNGKNHLSVTHVDNLCAAILCTLKSKINSQKEIFNIADKEAVQVDTLISHIKDKFNISAKNLYVPTVVANAVGIILTILFRGIRKKRPPLITKYIVYQMTSDHTLSVEKAMRMLEYKPLKSFIDF